MNIVMPPSVSTARRPKVLYRTVRLLPNLWTWYFENWFWCKLAQVVHGARTGNNQLWGSRDQRSTPQGAKNPWVRYL